MLKLRLAWLNLLDKHMTTGRINQVTVLLTRTLNNSCFRASNLQYCSKVAYHQTVGLDYQPFHVHSWTISPSMCSQIDNFTTKRYGLSVLPQIQLNYQFFHNLQALCLQHLLLKELADITHRPQLLEAIGIVLSNSFEFLVLIPQLLLMTTFARLQQSFLITLQFMLFAQVQSTRLAENDFTLLSLQLKPTSRSIDVWKTFFL